MSGHCDMACQALAKIGLQYEPRIPSFRRVFKVLVPLVAISISLAVLFSFTKASQYFSILPGGSHAHENSHLPDSSHIAESKSKQWDVDEWPVPEATPSPMRKNRRFVLIVPATSPDPNLCKMVLSAIALGYPTPIIVGWGMDYRSITKWDGGPNLIKVPAVLDYLDSVLRDDAHPSEKLEHDDVVLIADAYDVWFQLPPEVLLKRYHNINEKAISRLREQWHGQGPMPMQQTIVAGSEKNCWPRPSIGSDIQCPSLPDSPIREDLYGPETDKNQTDRHNLRPRYINGGVYIGQAGDIRRWFRRASSMMVEGISHGKKLRSEQGITGQVLGEQEVWRQWRRDNAEAKGEGIASALIQRDFEYHIGLDYFQVLSAQTHDAGDDGRIIVLGNQTDIDRHSVELDISPVRLRGLPDDIKTAQNPLAGLIDEPDWDEMPLYADFYTESVPVILHHNGKGPGQKKRRRDWWDLPWFFKYLRQLVQRRLLPGEPAVLATVQTENGTITYRPLDAEKLGKKPRIMKDSAVERLKEVDFNAICGAPNEAWWDEVLRDGQGSL